jgi:hypothetical protein
MKTLLLLAWMGCLLGSGLIFTGCSPQSKPPEAAQTEPGPDAVDEGPDETTVALEEKLANRKKTPRKAVAKAAPAPARQLGPGEQWCFGCDGRGNVACGEPGCKAGWKDCPGPCVTRKEGTWVRDPKPGMPAGSMAFILKLPGSRNSWTVSEYHAGEIWKLENGKLVSAGFCPTCGGSRTIQCTACQAGGVRQCPVCEGKTVLPTSWKPTDNPWFNRQPDVVRLKDGRVFLGRDAGGDDVIVMFRTHAGETLSVPRAEVVQWPKAQ